MSQATLSTPITLTRRLTVSLHAAMFVLGFSLIFIIGWGGAATVLGQLFGEYKTLLGQTGGALVMVFGFYKLGVINLWWLGADTRPRWEVNGRNGLMASALMGVFFAAGWTPCVGTILGAILTLGFNEQTTGQAMVLSSGYALGLGMPFLFIGLAMERATHFVRGFRRHLRMVEMFSGVLLILMGLLMLTGQMAQIAIWTLRNGLFLDIPLGGDVTPTYFIALLAGLISFFSPCVLPLVPAYVSYLTGHAFGHPLSNSLET